MITIYTYNGNVVKDSTTGKWFTKPSGPGPSPPAEDIEPDYVPDQSQYTSYTGYLGPGASGNKLDYNTTYTINYPDGYNILELAISIIHGNNWTWLDIDNVQPPPNTIKLSDYLTSSQWNDTKILCLTLFDNSYEPIYQPITLTPVS